MMEFLIEGERLAWTAVCALVFLTVLLLGTDLVWRMSKLSGKVLLLHAMIIGTAGVLLIFRFG